MSLNRIFGLFLRHFYLITRSFPRILDIIYWPSIQITLWGFISNFFASHSEYYNNAVGVILTCAILYDFLFRTSIGFNMLFLDEPTASLDPEIGDYIRSFLEDYKKEKKISILLASHNMNEVTRLCKTVLMMKDGIIIDKGFPEELIKKHGRKNMEEVFLKLSRSGNEFN